MALSPQDYRKTLQTHRRGTRAAQPAANTVLDGTLYYVTDEAKTERANGGAWEDYTDGGGGGIINNYYTNSYALFSPFDGEDGEDAFPIPGPPGPAGANGTSGSIGVDGRPGQDGLDGADGLDGFSIVGPAGSNGINGTNGAPGIPGPPGLDGEDAEPPYIIPGPIGPQGPAGSAGGGITYNKFTQNLGDARRSGTFDITGLSGLTVDKVVNIVQTADAISSKGNARDEFEMNAIVLTGYVLDAATIRVYWYCDSVVAGTYAFAYAVSG